MILFLHGTDPYQLAQKVKEFKEVAIERNGDFNVEQLDGKDLDINRFKDVISALPFLGDKRLIIFSNIISGKDAEFCNEVLEYVKDFSREDLNLIFVEYEKIDKRKGLSKFLLGDSNVKQFECNLLEGSKLDDYIRQQFLKRNKEVAPAIVSELSVSVGSNLSALENEIEKISLYAGSDSVDVEMCRKLVHSQIHSDVFKMIDGLAKKNFNLAAKEFHKLLENGDNEFYLFTMLVYQFRNLIRVKYLSTKGNNESAIAKLAGLHPFVVKKTLASANAFSFDDLINIYQQLYLMDKSSKSVSGFNLKLEIDLFTYRLCR